MLCYAVPCRAVPYYTKLCYAMSCVLSYLFFQQRCQFIVKQLVWTERWFWCRRKTTSLKMKKIKSLGQEWLCSGRGENGRKGRLSAFRFCLSSEVSPSAFIAAIFATVLTYFSNIFWLELLIIILIILSLNCAELSVAIMRLVNSHPKPWSTCN